MNILGFDTSTKLLPIVLGNEKGVLAACDIDSYIKHSAMIIPSIIRLLKKSRFKKEDIDVVAVGLGPGSLTGIRVGLATAKGLCVGLNRPILGICSLDIIAQNVNEADVDICPLIDAKRSLVFSAIYRRCRGRFRRIRPPRISSIEEVLSCVNSDVVFLGDGVGIYKDIIKRKIKKSYFVAERDWYPRAENILKTALLYKDKKKPCKDNLNPIYLYPKECQVRR